MTKRISKLSTVAAALVVSIGGVFSSTGSAFADSCWNHNGSLMRLKASGNQRWFYYEDPRSVLRRAGVRQGTLLFNGRKNGNSYSGTARRFSKYCSSPLQYNVRGPVSSNQLRVTVRGSRDVYRAGCVNSGKRAYDTLVFTYSHDC